MIETKQITGCQALGTGFGTKEKEGPFWGDEAVWPVSWLWCYVHNYICVLSKLIALAELQ